MKVFVVFQRRSMVDVIVTDDVVGARDQATLREWFAQSPDMSFFLAEQHGRLDLPTGCKWWPNLNEYMGQFGLSLSADS